MLSDSVAATAQSASTPPATARVRRRMSGVVARLTAANMLGAATGFITGPLLARALGASGRGDLAAIQVPLVLAPAVLGFGIPPFAYRELPRGRAIQEVIGSLGVPLLMIGSVAAACSIPIADALAGGRETVRAFLIVVMLAMPLLLLGSLLMSSLAALERWRSVVTTSLIPFVVPFLATVVLYALGRLTVATAAAVTIGSSLLSLAPGLWLSIKAGWPVFRLSIARRGISFGVRSWLGGLALLANSRLDQFLMITAVAPRVLGLYAVATTISGASAIATGGLVPPLMARIAAGEKNLLPHAIRITVAATMGLNLMLALATPVILSVLFGPEFQGAVPMAILLLVANVPQAGASVLSSALQADGAPLIPSIGEVIALVITVVGLILLLGPLGGVGAAIVSIAAYATSFFFQLAMARRRLGVALGEFIVLSRDDLRWAGGVLGSVIARLRPGR